MFHTFFPRPLVFFSSLVLWTVFAVIGWFYFGENLGNYLGFSDAQQKVIGLGHFTQPSLIWFYIYFIAAALVFSFVWFLYAPHKWQYWSLLGSLLILLSTHFSVQVSVAINNWRRPFFDLVQNALDDSKPAVTPGELYWLLLVFAQIAFVWMFVYVVTRFFVSHYIFRWRTAMNDYYVSRWSEVRHIEGASQRVQEDTMQFARIMEGIGVAIVDSVMTLFAFLPILFELSSYVTELPIIGKIPAPLFNAAIFWSIFGTILLLVAGIKLPGLEFRNQRVEAAYRKELVYGEDDEKRAKPPSLTELFANVRKNYFRIYFHYIYFNVFRGFYIQADNIFAYLLLIPTIAARTITFGILQQILTAFSQVTNSFQFLVNSWTTIIDLISIYKRLAAFEATLDGQALSDIDREWLENQGQAEE